MASNNKANSEEVGKVMMSTRKDVMARRSYQKNIVIEKGFAQVRIRKIIQSLEVCETVVKVNNKRRLEGSHGDNIKSASKQVVLL
jgi:hypothetical protein